MAFWCSFYHEFIFFLFGGILKRYFDSCIKCLRRAPLKPVVMVMRA
jgi:hypothetical protein